MTCARAPKTGANTMSAYHRILLTVGSALCGLWCLAAFFPWWFAPFDPLRYIMPLQKPLAPVPDAIGGGTFWLGTDLLGRDILSRAIWAAGTTFGLVIGTIFLTYLIGLPIALAAIGRNRIIAAAAGGLSAVGRGVPVFISYLLLGILFRFGPLAFALAFVFASLPNLIDWLSPLRRALESTGPDRPTTHQIAAYAATDALKRLVFWVSIAECIAFFGFGPFAPAAPTFGGMIGENRAMALAFPHTVLGPVAALFILLLGPALLASGLEALLPTSLRTADPARPSYRPGDIRDRQESSPRSDAKLARGKPEDDASFD